MDAQDHMMYLEAGGERVLATVVGPWCEAPDVVRLVPSYGVGSLQAHASLGMRTHRGTWPGSILQIRTGRDCLNPGRWVNLGGTLNNHSLHTSEVLRKSGHGSCNWFRLVVSTMLCIPQVHTSSER